MMVTWFFIFLFALFCLASYYRPLWGLAGVILFLPSYLWRFSCLGLPFSFLELMIGGLFIIWLLKDKRFLQINFSLKKKATNEFPPAPRYLLIAWLLVSLLALVVNPTWASLGLWRAYFLEPLLFCLIFVYTVKTKKDLRLIINALGILVAWLWVVAIYQNFTTWNFLPAYNFPNIKRLTAVFSYPNALGLLVAPLASLFAGLWLTSQDKKRDILYATVFVLGFSSALLARSEGAIGGVVVSLIIWLILAKKVRKFGLPLAIISLLIFFLFASGAEKINSFKQQLFFPQLDLQATSLEIRSSQWQEAWQLLQPNFWAGAGLNGYQLAVAPYHHETWLEVYLYPHNLFLNFWVELGLFGLLVFWGFLIYIINLLKKLFLAKNNLAWPFLLMWLTWFVHGLVDVPYFKNDLSVLFFILFLLTFLAQKHRLDIIAK
jgi:putative inorganic carbon (HCO3(-)) transporter